jgi:ribonuclease PH
MPIESPFAALRPDGRAPDQLRPVSFQLDIAPAAQGSVLISMGRTQVICGVSVDADVPRWMKQQKVSGGWITSEYSMLPYATTDRSRREVSAGKISGRTQEIQRLIGRSLRAICDLEALGSRTVWLDCDVLQADGGTRTASVTGLYVAFDMAMRRLIKQGVLVRNPLKEAVAAISVGMVGGKPVLDLCYEEDAAAATDMNVVMTASERFVEVQGTAEEDPYTADDLNQMLKLAGGGIRELLAAQQSALANWQP